MTDSPCELCRQKEQCEDSCFHMDESCKEPCGLAERFELMEKVVDAAKNIQMKSMDMMDALAALDKDSE